MNSRPLQALFVLTLTLSGGCSDESNADATSQVWDAQAMDAVSVLDGGSASDTGQADAAAQDVSVSDVVAADAGGGDDGTSSSDSVDDAKATTDVGSETVGGDTLSADANSVDAGPGDIAGSDVAASDSGVADASMMDSGAFDAGTPDSGASDTGSPDSGAPDVQQDAGPITCNFSFEWTGPTAGTFHAVGDQVVLTGKVNTSAFVLDKLKVEFTANSAVIGVANVAKSGAVSWSTTNLPQGAVALTARVITPQGHCQGTTNLGLGLCQHKIAENFNTKPTGKVWKTYGDAYWDKGGFLEITGNVKSKQGAFYDVIHSVTPGDASVRFRIATGGGINGGADGYALNFVDAKTVWDLEQILKKAGAGGCLGYGVAGACGSMKIDAFHVEFDTWQNKGDPNKDPTSSNHVGILLNGNASDHKLHVAIPGLEDLKWHDVRVDVVGTTVKVFWDGKKKVEKAISGLDFRGGRIFISGSTGWATNFHRLDDLIVLHGCK